MEITSYRERQIFLFLSLFLSPVDKFSHLCFRTRTPKSDMAIFVLSNKK